MRPKSLFPLILISLAGCSSTLVKESELDELNSSYTSPYEVIATIKDPSLRSSLPAGMRVKIYFEANSESFRVYAYPANQSFEESVARQIIYLIEEDFPDSKFSRAILDKELKKLVIESK